MPPRPKKKVKSFKVPPFYYIPTIIGGMSLITVVALSPDLIPVRKTVVPGKVPSLHGLRPPHSLLRYLLCSLDSPCG
ncbi:hypothetical protein GBAR_LOCUS28033 [Geodia barretti]|uniref:Uncharacterized protein n=1 Tax=Geodia barretti TaxID=519541 RepID=A0AA35XH07_GEOBA|nr:hypothetical protein GBAR_LOCUS28033 [Geodia barretti]